MTPESLFTGLVTTKLSSSGITLDSEEFKTNIEEWADRCLRTLSDANVDLRVNAIGFLTPYSYWQIYKDQPSEIWSGVHVPHMLLHEFLIRTNKPESLLFIGGMSMQMPLLPLAPKEIFDGLKDAQINFMNDAGLFMFEKTLKNVHEQTSFGYSVYDRSELISETSEKFDMISVMAWDIAYDLELLNALVSNLATNGILVISHTSNTSGIYSSSYRWNSHYGLHEALLEAPGASYHLPLFYGTTLFVKN